MVTYLGSLFQYCCGDRGTLQTNISGTCGECFKCLGHTGFAPAHATCAFPPYTSQVLGCSARELSEVGPGLCALPRFNPLRFRFSGSPQRGRLGWACVFLPFPGPSISGDQVLGKRCLPRWGVCLITSLVPATWFPGWQRVHPSPVCPMSLLGS